MEYQIGDFSKISRISIKTLRYYHEIGLLSPTRIDSDSGYRYYDESSIEKARIICKLKNMDFSLSEISEMLTSYNEDADLLNHMARKLNAINEEMARYKQIQVKLKEFIKKEEISMPENSEIVYKDVPDILIAAIRFKGRYEDIGEQIGKLFKNCGRYAKGSPFALYYDGDYKEEDADIEICLPVSKAINKDSVTSRILQGSKVISIIHRGPYESIGKSYKNIIDYINDNHVKTCTPSREIYIKGPGMIFKGNPQNYITEIQIMTD